MTKEETAKHIFARNPKVKELHFTSDNTPFYEKHHADAHGQRLKNKDIATIERSGKKEVAPATPPAPEFPKGFEFLEGNLAKVSEKVETVKTVEELEAILAAEVATGDRKGVKAAIADRKTALEEINNAKSQDDEQV